MINTLTLDKPFGISINISLNSLMNGGNTRIDIVNTMNDIPNKTINKEINLGSFKMACISLHKLLTTFDITNEQTINNIKSLKVHIIKKLIIISVNLKYKERFNFNNKHYYFSEYPNPFDFA